METSDITNTRIVTRVKPVNDMSRVAEYPAPPQDQPEQKEKRAAQGEAPDSEIPADAAPNLIYHRDGSTEDLTQTTARPSLDVTG